MNPETLIALKKSIEHHKRLLARKPYEHLGYNGCALCDRFCHECKSSDSEDAETCPVALKTGKDSCIDSPYGALEKHVIRQHGIDLQLSEGCATCTCLEEAEIVFLESLLPELVSNCCSVPVPGRLDSDFCPKCKEHCEAVDLARESVTESTDVSLRCSHCKKEEVVKVSACVPHTEEHWQCPKCDSTYCLEEYPKPKKE